MTGPEHYRESERVLAVALTRRSADAEGFTGWTRGDLLTLAQLHATLAVVEALS